MNGTGLGAPAFPNTLSNLPAGAVLPAQTIFAPDPDLKLAYNIQNSAQYARGFGRSYNGSIGVVYNRGYNLPVITDINLINPVGHAGRRPRHLQHDGERRDPHGSALQPHQRRAVAGRVDLQGAAADVRQALHQRRAVRPELHARQGHRHGAARRARSSRSRAISRARIRKDLARDKGPNALDTRHSFNGSIVAMSRFNHGGDLGPRTLLSDNQVGVILQFNSGLPFTLTSNRDLNVDGNTADRPLNIGRNSYYLPSRYNVDARLSRFIPLGGTPPARGPGRVQEHLQHRPDVGDPQRRQRRHGGQRPVAAGVRHVAVDADVAAVDSSDFLPTNGYEQRKFQLGFKFAF